ncbi:hypothetical protein BOTBODRAFT_28407 [Botryobasidium botryosum FD-172 SS1]|uniref:Major facilitator superfamily (MFS) profile domain-containing protein n=1 Tax=Botryobasidium botryosum (strain FD-172 SS1) TaxID=930990 RepID=A0A067MW55_BOTB1|nr:hypothetical protein BOTBODRAFT_28407 [Botryobasidium botryosum FD-172 SS1]
MSSVPSSTSSLPVTEKSSHMTVSDGPSLAEVEANQIDYAKFKKIVLRKVDRRLLPILGCLYSVALMDRMNLSTAFVAGAAADLHLAVSNRYSVLTLLFFVSYILVELPSNLFIRRFGPRKWLGVTAVLWGVVTLCTAFVNDWRQLAALRVLMGALEGGFFPGCVYLISTWYVRREVQTRLAAFYLLSTFIAGFIIVLGYSFTLMEGLGGIRGWRWIYIMGGLITLVVALVANFVIVDFPDQNTFLTPEQTAFVHDRIQKDRNDAEYDPFTWDKLLKYAREPKLWIFGLMYLGVTAPTYAIGYFLPIILGGMGFSTRDSQLLSAPPYVASVVSSFIVAVFSDRTGLRAPFIAGQTILTIFGLALIAYSQLESSRLVGVFFAVMGTQGNFPAILAWQSNNVVGQSKRAFSSALTVMFAGFGGIVASTVFRSQDSPNYFPGLWTCIGLQLMNLGIIACLTVAFWRKNKKARVAAECSEGEDQQYAKDWIEGRKGFFYTL